MDHSMLDFNHKMKVLHLDVINMKAQPQI